MIVSRSARSPQDVGDQPESGKTIAGILEMLVDFGFGGSSRDVPTTCTAGAFLGLAFPVRGDERCLRFIGM